MDAVLSSSTVKWKPAQEGCFESCVSAIKQRSCARKCVTVLEVQTQMRTVSLHLGFFRILSPVGPLFNQLVFGSVEQAL